MPDESSMIIIVCFTQRVLQLLLIVATRMPLLGVIMVKEVAYY